MMKRNQHFKLVGLALALAVPYFGSSQLTIDHQSLTVGEFMNSATSMLVVEQLSPEERNGLIHMREEEKLAFDVYTALAKAWGIRPFGNITNAEAKHMESVKTLLDRYSVADPIKGLKPGEFKSEEFKKLYADLLKQGKVSRVEAYKVGAKIEDLDIFDLKKLAKETKRSDFHAVYENLRLGSENHLRAFVRNLQRSGESYQPLFITQAEFDAIVKGKKQM